MGSSSSDFWLTESTKHDHTQNQICPVDEILTDCCHLVTSWPHCTSVHQSTVTLHVFSICLTAPSVALSAAGLWTRTKRKARSSKREQPGPPTPSLARLCLPTVQVRTPVCGDDTTHLFLLPPPSSPSAPLSSRSLPLEGGTVANPRGGGWGLSVLTETLPQRPPTPQRCLGTRWRMCSPLTESK